MELVADQLRPSFGRRRRTQLEHKNVDVPGAHQPAAAKVHGTFEYADVHNIAARVNGQTNALIEASASELLGPDVRAINAGEFQHVNILITGTGEVAAAEVHD